MKRLQGKEEPRRVEERRRDRGNEREGYKMRRANLFVRQVCPQIISPVLLEDAIQ